jgi:IS30 family transposase
MSKLIPGNQKHLTLDDRIVIETSLADNESFKNIAKILCKDPTTISKEIKLHRTTQPRNRYNEGKNKCELKFNCSKKNICNIYVPVCKKKCSVCPMCNSKCKEFIPLSYACLKLDKAPFVCNGCPKKAGNSCRLDKIFYHANTANRQYKTVLVEARNGINLSEEKLIIIDSIISPLILKGHSPYVILENNPEIGISEKTIYNYIESGVLSVKNIDLPKKVKYKPRKTSTEIFIRDNGIFEGRTYNDFTKYITLYPESNVVEMDTVLGCEGSRKVLLTLYFRNCHLMLAYLLDHKRADLVTNVFDRLEKKICTLNFCLTFPVILTDRGTEFSNPNAIESGIDNIIRTSVYYCDPMASWQKPGIEKNHEYIRKILPKGSNFDKLTQFDIDCVMSNINSTPRASLNGMTPLRLAKDLIHEQALKAFNLRDIPANEVVLTNDLLK